MFGNRLKEERERLKLNQTEFGKVCNVRQQAQLKYEKGERQPKSDYLQKASEIGVDINYLFTGQRTTNSLSDDEIIILKKYRDSDESTKNKVLLTLMTSEKDKTKDSDKPKDAINIGHNESSPLITGGENTVNYNKQSGFTEVSFLLSASVCSIIALVLGILANLKIATNILISTGFIVPSVLLWAVAVVMEIFRRELLKQKETS